MLPELQQALRDELAALKTSDRARFCPPMAGGSRVRPLLDGRPLLSFCSNDYLGLASHPALAAAPATTDVGLGAGASRLISGDLPAHRDLEAALADFLGATGCLLFSTGYQANLGAISALAGRGDLIVSDAANHASLIDGCRLSRATVRVYPHRDVAAAAAAFSSGPPAFRRRFLITESVFSMDGDIAPLADLAAVCQRHRAALVVDEAHALGALGPGGRGLCRQVGVDPDVLIGTLGKAFGTFGGFVAGCAELRSVLINRARTFIFTTAPPASVAAASLASLKIIRSRQGDRLRESLRGRIAQLHQALTGRPTPTAATLSPIFPLILGSDRAALDASRALRQKGIFVQAVRPPTVPEGSARLRITFSAAHQAADVALLAAALTDLTLAQPAAAP